MPGHESIAGKGRAYQLAKFGSENLFKAPEQACSISVGVAKKVVRDYTNRDHKKHWDSLTGQKETLELIQGTSCPPHARACTHTETGYDEW